MLKITKQTILTQSAYDYLEHIIGGKGVYQMKYKNLNIYIEKSQEQIFIRACSIYDCYQWDVLKPNSIEHDISEWMGFIRYILSLLKTKVLT